MKNRSFIIFLLGLFIYSSAVAQENKLKFHSVNTIGLADGESKAHLLLQTINGLAFGKWFAGIGFGADYYHYKSYPLFIDARRYFGKKNKGFAYGDLGYNLSGKDKPGKEVYYYTAYHFHSGVYTDIGIGYQIKFAAKSSLIFSAGYSYKEINSRIAVAEECFAAPCNVDYSTYKYGDGRVVLKAGVDF